METEQKQDDPGRREAVPDKAAAENPRTAPGWANAGAAALLLALAALVLLALSWVDNRGRDGRLEQNLGRRLGEIGGEVEKARLLSAQAQEGTREALVKLGILENRQAESAAQQLALESLYQELSRGRDEWALAEVEQVLLMANEQLSLTGNVKAALIALQTADSRLARLDRPQLAPLRKTIGQDIARLQALPPVDVAEISLRLDNLIGAIDAMPLQFGDASLPERAPAAVNADEPAWSRLAREMWADFRQLVRIRNMEKPDAQLLPPSQEYFLRENLKLRLLTARIALLQRNEASYKADLKAAETLLTRHYDTKAKPIQQTLASLRQLAGSPVSIEPPDISGSLHAARNFKLARERGQR